MNLPWERQKDEPLKAWEAFAAYRDMGMARSQSKVAEKLHKSRPTMGRWSALYSWTERCRAWDAYLDSERRRALLKEAEAAARRHAKIAQSMLEEVDECVNAMRTPDEQGKVEQLPLDQVVRWFDSAVKAERLALGLSTESIATDVLTQAKADAISQNIVGLVNGLIVLVPEENRDEYREQLAAGVARILGKDPT